MNWIGCNDGLKTQRDHLKDGFLFAECPISPAQAGAASIDDSLTQ